MKRKKNGFTLIELLAVIVILAIIALIATPIILGIVEDARRDAFERSVELVLSTTDLDVSNKNIQEGYKYEIVDGTIPNLEVGIKNTQGMNGEIYYDETGNSVFAIHNGVYCVKKTADMEKAEISDYVEGECVAIKTAEKLFATITKMVPNEDDTVTNGTGVLSNLGVYGIRYQGADPNNYVYFNCSDYTNQTAETCEVWRIIGIVDGKVKIMKSNGYSKTDKWSTSITAWSTASLQTYLNGEYYNAFSEDTKNMISLSDWHTINIYKSSLITSPSVLFELERKKITNSYAFDYETFNANIGISYPSDYLFAAIENDACIATGIYLSCTQSNWYPEGWLIISSSFGAYHVDNISVKSLVELPVDYSRGVNPTLYLSSEVELKEGQGTSALPYQLSM